MDWVYSVGLKFLYPTAAAAVVLGLGLVFVRRAAFCRACLGLGLGILLVCGNGWVVEGMVRWLEGKYRTPDAAVSADCIVVLGGGTVPGIAPRTMVEVSEAGDRVLYAARLFRDGKAPLVLCTSGVATGGLALRPPSEDMAELVEFFGVPRTSILLETASGNTREHARNLVSVFQERGFKRILLVTSAMHMPRSMGVFQKYCPEVEFIAAPTDFRATEGSAQFLVLGVDTFDPNPEAFRRVFRRGPRVPWDCVLPNSGMDVRGGAGSDGFTMQRIPFYRPSVGQDEINEVVATLKGGWLTTGPKTKQFEAEFGAYIGQQHSVAVNSCTAALHLALEAIGVQRDDGVLVPTMTFAATAEVVRYFGARPVLVDCRQDDFNLDVADAERRIAAEQAAGRRVVAIMPVHYGGQIGDVAGVRRLATRHGLKVIEDAAHCCPAYYWDDAMALPEAGAKAGPVGGDFPAAGRGRTDLFAPPPAESGSGPRPGGWRSVGADADISCYSFYANKTITTGEGGMACTNHDGYADRMRIMSLHGISRDAWKRFTAEGSWYYEIIAPGFKYNLTDIASAIGIHQVRKADRLHQLRMALAAQYQAGLADVEEIILPTARPDRVHSRHLFPIRLRPGKGKMERAELIAELQRRGIGTSVHWLPLHMHPYYRETYGYKPEDYQVAAGVYPGLVTLPLYPDMGEKAVDLVCTNLKELVRGR